MEFRRVLFKTLVDGARGGKASLTGKVRSRPSGAGKTTTGEALGASPVVVFTSLGGELRTLSVGHAYPIRNPIGVRRKRHRHREKNDDRQGMTRVRPEEDLA